MTSVKGLFDPQMGNCCYGAFQGLQLGRRERMCCYPPGATGHSRKECLQSEGSKHWEMPSFKHVTQEVAGSGTRSSHGTEEDGTEPEFPVSY